MIKERHPILRDCPESRSSCTYNEPNWRFLSVPTVLRDGTDGDAAGGGCVSLTMARETLAEIWTHATDTVPARLVACHESWSPHAARNTGLMLTCETEAVLFLDCGRLDLGPRVFQGRPSPLLGSTPTWCSRACRSTGRLGTERTCPVTTAPTPRSLLICSWTTKTASSTAPCSAPRPSVRLVGIIRPGRLAQLFRRL